MGLNRNAFRRALVAIALVAPFSLAACRQNVDCGAPPKLAADELPAPKMLPYLTCQAEGNDAQAAQFYLGVIFDDGNLGVPQNYAEAAKWYEKAAKDRPGSGLTGVYMPPVGNQRYGSWIPLTPRPGSPGIAHAQYRLGIMYRDGLGVPRDPAKAKEWLEKAAKQGHQPAIEALANLPR